ncbi:MAG: GNAT family N-acetyltransferase [Anaerolineae bacterium]|nr:GNAT family N-acetyltransferase [Anaerolineae bacterium]MBT7188765.1 GNAT family N-acetyltransferase [Anaerolineae bacterium]MBT7600572.1 GNAT family N-acetyltransferase [Anaerolineae bacterium]MBT7988746.1 GNAT family N-acetyltransferase [Anaerolineae bacterium]
MQNKETLKNSPRTIRHITSIAAFEDLRYSWNALLEKKHIRSAVLTWEWLFSWWKVFGDEKKLWLVTVWEDDRLIGVAPLMLEKRRKIGMPLQVLCTLGTPMNDIGGFIVQDQDLQIVKILSDFILEQKREWDIFELNEFPVEGLEISVLKDIFSQRNFRLIEENNEHYYIPVEGSWDDYYSSLSKKFRKNLRRAERNSAGLGNVFLKQYSGNGLTWGNFDEAIAVNCHANYPRICHSKKEQAFLKELFELAPQWLTLYLLFINDEAVAYEYGFLYQNRFEDWRAGFDTRIDPAISIGKFIALKVLEKSFEDGLKEVDFMRGAHAYKQEWRPETRIYTQLRFFKRQSPKAMIAYLGLEKIKPLLRRF